MKSHFINTAGETVIDVPDLNLIGNFHEGLAKVNYFQRYYGFINKSGKLVIETPFVEVRDFSENLAVVKIQEKGFYGQAKTSWGAIDQAGRIIFEGDFDKLNDFSEDIAIAEKSGKMFFVNKTGEIVQTFDKSEFCCAGDRPKFSEGLLAVWDEKTRKHGFINKVGEFAIAPEFTSAADFSDGLARVSISENNKEFLGFIDLKGEYAIEPKFEFDHDFLRNTNDFSEGLASLIDAPPMLYQNQTFNFIDKTGKIVYKTEFFRAEIFREGLCRVWSQRFICGYIDKSGELAIPIKYWFASDFSEGLALVA